MKKTAIALVFSLCVTCFTHASQGEVTSYDSTTGKYTVGKIIVPPKLIPIRK